MVSLLRWKMSMARVPLLGGGLEPQALGALADDPLLGLDGGDHLGLDAAFEASGDRLRGRWSRSGRR